MKVIPIPLTKDIENAFDELSKELGSKYKIGKYGVLALYSLIKLGFRWYHIKVLYRMISARTALNFGEDLKEHLEGVLNFIDNIVKNMISNNIDDLRIFFTDKEITELMRDVQSKQKTDC